MSARHLVRYAWPSNKNIIVQIAKEDYRTKGIEKIEFTCYFMGYANVVLLAGALILGIAMLKAKKLKPFKKWIHKENG